MPTAFTTLNRLALLEDDRVRVHIKIDQLTTKVDVLEAVTEKGFRSLEKRFDSLQQFLEERL